MVTTGNKCMAKASCSGKIALLVLSSADSCFEKELFVEEMSGCNECRVGGNAMALFWLCADVTEIKSTPKKVSFGQNRSQYFSIIIFLKQIKSC